MIPLVNESVQLIHIDSKTELKKPVIVFALNSARSTRRYAKFYSDKYYIMVTFQRDNTTSISTNYRHDAKFDRELTRFEKKLKGTKVKVNQLAHFIWYWMNIIRKK